MQSKAEAVGQVDGERVQHDLKAGVGEGGAKGAAEYAARCSGRRGGAEGESGGSCSDYTSTYLKHSYRFKKTNLCPDCPIVVVIHARPPWSPFAPPPPSAHLHVVIDREPQVVVHPSMQQQHTHKVLIGKPRAVRLRHMRFDDM